MQKSEIAVIVNRSDYGTAVAVWVNGVRIADGRAEVVVIDAGRGWTRKAWIADRLYVANWPGLPEGARQEALAWHDAADGSEFIDDEVQG